MNFPRRTFLGSSLLALGGTLIDALATPVWQWKHSLVLQATAGANPASPVQFVDVAREAGLNTTNVWGGTDHKRYIIEAKGSGIAFFDYDHDGWLDIYLTNAIWRAMACWTGPYLASVQEQPRWNVHRRYGEIRPGAHRLADGGLRGRLRQRWLG
jgi:hypothetical protein